MSKAIHKLWNKSFQEKYNNFVTIILRDIDCWADRCAVDS